MDRLATMRWSIEQCFLECICVLGVGHYETWSYRGDMGIVVGHGCAFVYGCFAWIFLKKKRCLFDFTYGLASCCGVSLCIF